MGTFSNRDQTLDGLKFILIFLVILGHLSYNDWGAGINKIIYSFHMPVFVFLSGYFTSQNTDKEKQRKWLKRTLLVYIFSQFAFFVMHVGYGLSQSYLRHEVFDLSLLSWRYLYVPCIALWYLICLIYWRLSVWRLFAKTKDIVLLCISISLAIVSGFIPIDEEFAFQRTFSFFPFFVIGMLFRKRGLMSGLKKVPYIYALLGLFIGLLFAKLLPFYMPKFHFEDWHDLLLRVTQSCLGIFLCLCILRVAQVDFIKRFAKFGLYTLWIYIGHIYLLRIGDKVFQYAGISLNLITALLLATVYCGVLISIAKLYYAIKPRLKGAR